MLKRARQFLDAAQAEGAAGWREVAFALARTAVELAGKALLLVKTGTYPPKEHAIGGMLARAGLVPRGMDKGELAQFLAQYSRGEYGVFESVSAREVTRALGLATTLVNAAEA